jgi:hypothetical protein
VKPPKQIKSNTKAKPIAKVKATAKPKVKPAFNLKGIPAKFKWVCTLAINNATTAAECDELVLVGINAYETLYENETEDIALKTEVQVVTQAILTKKNSYTPQV